MGIAMTDRESVDIGDAQGGRTHSGGVDPGLVRRHRVRCPSSAIQTQVQVNRLTLYFDDFGNVMQAIFPEHPRADRAAMV